MQGHYAYCRCMSTGFYRYFRGKVVNAKRITASCVSPAQLRTIFIDTATAVQLKRGTRELPRAVVMMTHWEERVKAIEHSQVFGFLPRHRLTQPSALISYTTR